MSEQAKPLAVLVLTTSLAAGGSQRFASMLLNKLDRARFAPELAVVSDSHVDHDIPSDVPISVLTAEPSIEPSTDLGLSQEQLRRFGADAAWSQALVDQIAHLVQRIRPAVVLCAPEWVAIPASAAALRFPDETRLVSRFGAPASMAFPDVGAPYLFSAHARDYLGRADRFVAVSPAIAEDLTANFGVDGARVVVMPNAVDAEKARILGSQPVMELPFGDDAPWVVFVGRVERVKGLEYLLRAITEANTVTPVRCVVVGEGSQRPYLRALAKHLGIDHRVWFVGSQTNPYRFMSKADVFVLPSLSEGLPNVLLEAMACGCPVIATDIAGGITGELLEEGVSGLIVERADHHALAAAILRVLGDTELRERLVRQGTRRVGDFGVPSMIRRYEEFLAEVAARPKLGRVTATSTLVASSEAAADAPHTEAAHVCAPRLAAQADAPSAAVPAPRGSDSRFLARVRQNLGARLRRRQEPKDAGVPGRPQCLAPLGDHGAADGVPAFRLLVLAPVAADMAYGTLTETLIRHLRRRGYEVCPVAVFDDASGFPDGEQDVPYSLTRHVSAAAVALMDVVQDSGANADELAWLATVAGKVADVAALVRADAILADGYMAARLALIGRRGASSMPPVLVKAGKGAREIASGAQGELEGILLREYLGTADGVIAADADEASDLTVMFDSLQGRVMTAPTGIDVDAVVNRTQDNPSEHPWFSEETPIFECVLELRGETGVAPLLAAVGMAASKAAFRVIVVARDEQLETIMGLVRALGVPDGIVDIVTGPDWAVGTLRNAAALIHPSPGPSTGVPDAIVGALALGTPVISTRCSQAVLELLDNGGAGLTFNAGDADALAEAMLQILWDDELREELASRGPGRLRALSFDAVADSIDAFLRAQAGRGRNS